MNGRWREPLWSGQCGGEVKRQFESSRNLNWSRILLCRIMENKHFCSVPSEVGHYVTRSVGEVRQEEGKGKGGEAKSASCGDDE